MVQEELRPGPEQGGRKIGLIRLRYGQVDERVRARGWLCHGSCSPFSDAALTRLVAPVAAQRTASERLARG